MTRTPTNEASATIRDVAEAAGVSIATVSRVLNQNARVSSEASARVVAAIAATDYWPNSAARSLPTRQTHVLGVLLPDLYGEFFSEVIRGIDLAARRKKFQVLLSSSHGEEETLMAAARSLPGRADGLIIMAPDDGSTKAIERIVRRFPVVLINPAAEIAGCRAVSVDNFHGARAVVRHLLGLGHRVIAMVKGPRDNHDAKERLRGYRDALREAGVQPHPGLEIAGDFTERCGFRAARVLARHHPRPSAVFAANDSTAIGFMCALDELGLDVPRDMAVAGFDDVAIAQYVTPGLTTAHVDASALGKRAVEILLSSNGTRSEVLSVPLVVRRSCGSGEGQKKRRSRR